MKTIHVRPPGMLPIDLTLDDEEWDTLERAARAGGVSVDALVASIVDEFVVDFMASHPRIAAAVLSRLRVH